LGSAELSLLAMDDALIRQGEAPEDFFVVRSGFLRVSQADRGLARTLVYLRPGEVFGLLSLLRGEQQNTCSITAASRSEVIRFRREALSRVLQKHPEARAALTQAAIAAEQLSRATDVGHSPVGERTSLVPDELVERGIAGGHEVLVVDQNKCTGCGNCIASCERRHGYGRLELRGQQVENYLFPTACRHCDDPTCLLCSVNGIIRLPSGEIKIVEENCIGCGACAQRCPYGNIRMHGVSERKRGFWFNLVDLLSSSPKREQALEALEPTDQQIAVKCDLCAGHGDYACVTACPVGAAFRVDPVAAFGGSS
jgi:Fe-S-cluster-containing hydrogenase component 2